MEEEGNNSYIQKRGWKLFFIRFSYMLVFTLALTYTFARVSGETIIESITVSGFVFTLPILFIIGFALAMWKFWYSIPWFVLATVIVNSLIFGFGERDGLSLSVIEVPIFLVVTLIVLALERGFSAIPKKWIRITLASLPFVIMLFVILLTYFK